MAANPKAVLLALWGWELYVTERNTTAIYHDPERTQSSGTAYVDRGDNHVARFWINRESVLRHWTPADWDNVHPAMVAKFHEEVTKKITGFTPVYMVHEAANKRMHPEQRAKLFRDNW